MMDSKMALKLLSNAINEGLCLIEVNRTYYMGEMREGNTTGIIVASEGLSLEDHIQDLWLEGCHKLVVSILGEENDMAKLKNTSIKEEIIRLLCIRNSIM